MTQPTVPPAPHADLRAARGQATRARLLAEALRLFAERGYEGVSTRAVALAAESNVALIAFHFGSKRGLYEAAVEAVAPCCAPRCRSFWPAFCRKSALPAFSPC